MHLLFVFFLSYCRINIWFLQRVDFLEDSWFFISVVISAVAGVSSRMSAVFSLRSIFVVFLLGLELYAVFSESIASRKS
jgi:hypothetical protein